MLFRPASCMMRCISSESDSIDIHGGFSNKHRKRTTACKFSGVSVRPHVQALWCISWYWALDTVVVQRRDAQVLVWCVLLCTSIPGLATILRRTLLWFHTSSMDSLMMQRTSKTDRYYRRPKNQSSLEIRSSPSNNSLFRCIVSYIAIAGCNHFDAEQGSEPTPEGTSRYIDTPFNTLSLNACCLSVLLVHVLVCFGVVYVCACIRCWALMRTKLLGQSQQWIRLQMIPVPSEKWMRMWEMLVLQLPRRSSPMTAVCYLYRQLLSTLLYWEELRHWWPCCWVWFFHGVCPFWCLGCVKIWPKYRIWVKDMKPGCRI